eukprot:scaffold20.g7824.t1
MGRAGIHPLLKQMTVVLRNGASIRVATVANRTTPYVMQTDVTNNPVWTGEKAGLSLEDKRIAKLMAQYQGFVDMGEQEPRAAGSGGKQ